MTYALATIQRADKALGCVEIEGRFFPLESADPALGLPSDLMALLRNWGGHLDALQRFADKCASEPSGGISSEEAKVIAPLLYPDKVVCAGANYYDHLIEMGEPEPRKESQRLFFFMKPPRTTIVGTGATVQYPLGSQMFDWEIELAVVIGKRSRRLTMDNALDSIAAYTVAIDLSARDFNRAPEAFYKFDWVAGKAQDTCCPLGPRIVPAAFVKDPQNLTMKLSVNGEVKQHGSTSGMVFDIREQLVTLSNIMTLEPGDVVLTGTPAGVGMASKTFLKLGDRIEAEIDSLGRLDVTVGPSV